VIKGLALASLVAGLALAGCGGDDDSGETTPPSVSIPAVTSPIPATTTPPPTTTTPTGPTGGSGGTSPPSGETPPSGATPKRPDSEANDVPPPPGSPQEAFEKQCEQNPAACG
jgi:hypothetical protein